MKNTIRVVIATVSLAIVLLIGSMKASWAIQKIADFKVSSSLGVQIARSPWQTPEGLPVKGCSVRPKLNPPKPNIETTFVPGVLTLERFRQKPSQAILPGTISPKTISPKQYLPKQYLPKQYLRIHLQIGLLDNPKIILIPCKVTNLGKKLP